MDNTEISIQKSIQSSGFEILNCSRYEFDSIIEYLDYKYFDTFENDFDCDELGD